MKHWVQVVAIIWISACAAISIALYFTHSVACLWFLLVPALMSIRTTDDEDNKDDR